MDIPEIGITVVAPNNSNRGRSPFSRPDKPRSSSFRSLRPSPRLDLLDVPCYPTRRRSTSVPTDPSPELFLQVNPNSRRSSSFSCSRSPPSDVEHSPESPGINLGALHLYSHSNSSQSSVEDLSSSHDRSLPFPDDFPHDLYPYPAFTPEDDYLDISAFVSDFPDPPYIDPSFDSGFDPTFNFFDPLFTPYDPAPVNGNTNPIAHQSPDQLSPVDIASFQLTSENLAVPDTKLPSYPHPTLLFNTTFPVPQHHPPNPSLPHPHHHQLPHQQQQQHHQHPSTPSTSTSSSTSPSSASSSTRKPPRGSTENTADPKFEAKKRVYKILVDSTSKQRALAKVVDLSTRLNNPLVKEVFDEAVDSKVKTTPASQQRANGRRSRPADFSCILCLSQFTTNNNRQNHYRSHLRMDQYQCSRCSTFFRTDGIRRRHTEGAQKCLKLDEKIEPRQRYIDPPSEIPTI